MYKACWFTSTDAEQLDRFQKRYARHIAEDKDGHPVFLAEESWTIKTVKEAFPDVELHFTSEFKIDAA